MPDSLPYDGQLARPEGDLTALALEEDAALVRPEQLVVIQMPVPPEQPLADVHTDQNITHASQIGHREWTLEFLGNITNVERTEHHHS